MNNEIRGFICLALAVLTFCTHQLCDRMFWLTASLNSAGPGRPSVLYGGITLFVLTLVFLALAVLFFVRGVKQKRP